MLSIGLVCVVVFFLTITEEFEFLRLSFETVSAFANVGLTTGITPGLSIAGKLIIIVIMFIGRLGPLTLTLALVRTQSVSIIRYPREIIRVG
jgi:trk system potassium uptake protein TrkH